MSFFAPPPTDTERNPLLFAPTAPPEHSHPPSYQNVLPSVLPPAGHTSASDRDPHLNPSVVVIVVILSVVFILSGFLHLLARCLGRRRGHPPPLRHSPLVSALHGQLQHLFNLHDAGVEQAFIDTLPVFAYGSIRGLKDSADCAVCLTEFGDDDRLRLLPKCKHAFHLECIDTWLLSNSTCPLCRRSLLPDPHAHNVNAASSSNSTLDADMRVLHSSRVICAVPDKRQSGSLEEHLVRDSRRMNSIHGSIHGSYQNSFRICDVEDRDDSETEIQEIEEEIDEAGAMAETPSPFAPTIRIMDEHGTSRVMKVELGRVAGNNTKVKTDSRLLTKKGGRSYSMGSYEYVVDPSKWELLIAPTPFPGRAQDWASSKPAHRSALSDSIPELASAGGTPANDELFWASRGLYNPHTLSRVRELLTPIGSDYSNGMFSPAGFLDYSYSPEQDDRWIDIDIERGEIIEVVEEEEGEFVRGKGQEEEGRFSNASLLEFVAVGDSKDHLKDQSKDQSDFKQRSSSLSRLPEGKICVSLYRRSFSETSLGMEQAVNALGASKDGKCEWDEGAGSLGLDQSVKQGSFSRRFSLNWLMGRDKRVVFSASSPSPVADSDQQRTRPITI